MKVNNQSIIHYTSEDIKELIREDCEKHGYNPTKININLKKKQWTEGGGGMPEIDYETLILEEITVVCDRT